ncbi:MAG: HAD hydrolase family protein [Catenisphaera adipataccumulans]|jgi:Cof subfamily protein (haloacid dehalogenase superfamily)|uniref:HAD hydrolase family protein n=1 Tax=Catenisphaera adipataccumulans TaxID=700500 RepID=UPI003D90638F
MIQLFVSDLDGTLLNRSHQWDEEIVRGIDQLLKADRSFAIATGRDSQLADLGPVDRKAYVICMNGAQILDPDHQTLKLSPMSEQTVREFVQAFPEAKADFASDSGIYRLCTREEYAQDERRQIESYEGDPDWVKKFLTYKRQFVKFLDSPDQLKGINVCKINWSVRNDPLQEKIDRFVTAHPDICNAPYAKHFCELTRADVNKATAIQWLAHRLHFRSDEVAVYGDGGNDIEMLKAFDHSYAPSNASPSAIAAANYTVGPFETHSVIHHMVEMTKKA